MGYTRWQTPHFVVSRSTAREVSPTGMTARPPNRLHPAGDDPPSAVRPPPRRHLKQSRNTEPAWRKARQADPHLVTRNRSYISACRHGTFPHGRDEDESRDFGGGQNAPHEAAITPGSFSRHP